MPSVLFSPIELDGLTFPNRIAVAPMCQYSAEDGSATDWHMQHWMVLAMSGAGMVTMEATGVEPRGRITPRCLGLYSEANEAAAARVLAAARKVAAPGARFGIQLAHAGRKASTGIPWHGGGPLKAEEGAWQTVAPSAIPFDPEWHIPEALDEAGIDAIVAAFVGAAERAERAGFDFVELHGAHGYLLHTFLSPISNRRSDTYGGSLENRMLFIVEVARAVRAALPARMILGARLSAVDWIDGGLTIQDSIAVARALKAAGVAYICASSGGLTHAAKPAMAPLYQVPFAAAIQREAGIAARAVGMIDDPVDAEAIVAEGQATLVALARAMLADPRWPWRAAIRLGVKPTPPPQYARAVGAVMPKWVLPPQKEAAE